MESLDALKSAQEVEIQVNSEVSGVQLLLTKSQQVWLLSNDKDRVLGKFTQLGGFGSGSYTKAVECGEGVAYKLPLKDRTPVQIDETSLRGNAPTGSVSTMTLYKLMVLTEKEKGVTSHKISYLNVSRSEEVEAGCDSFNVDMKEDMKFKLLPVEADKVNCKSFFGKCAQSTETSKYITRIFRYRFERVGLSLKVQKPYIVSSCSISLQKGKPFKIADPSS